MPDLSISKPLVVSRWEILRRMTRCWKVEPRSERVIDDFEALPRVLTKIIEADGKVVQARTVHMEFFFNLSHCQDINFRSGRRRIANKDISHPSQPSSRRGRSTARECHLDCLEARDKAYRAAALQATKVMTQTSAAVHEQFNSATEMA